jgi:predicted metalloprotease with PDZ domain
MISDMHYGSPAYQAGLGPGMKIIGVNGRLWSMEAMREALKRRKPLDLLVAQGMDLKNFRVDYVDGERFPTLEAIPGAEDFLACIAEAKVKGH